MSQLRVWRSADKVGQRMMQIGRKALLWLGRSFVSFCASLFKFLWGWHCERHGSSGTVLRGLSSGLGRHDSARTVATLWNLKVNILELIGGKHRNVGSMATGSRTVWRDGRNDVDVEYLNACSSTCCFVADFILVDYNDQCEICQEGSMG